MAVERMDMPLTGSVVLVAAGAPLGVVVVVLAVLDFVVFSRHVPHDVFGPLGLCLHRGDCCHGYPNGLCHRSRWNIRNTTTDDQSERSCFYEFGFDQVQEP